MTTIAKFKVLYNNKEYTIHAMFPRDFESKEKIQILSCEIMKRDYIEDLREDNINWDRIEHV